jgi:WD40 repeat protein
MAAVSCPDSAVLERFVLGMMSADEAKSLSQHVESCERCVTTLHGIRTEDTLVASMRQAGKVKEQLPAGVVERLTQLAAQAPVGATFAPQPAPETSFSGATVSLDQQALDRFEAAWHAGRPETLETYLPAGDDPQYLPTLVELVQMDLDFRWKAWNAAPAHATQTGSWPDGVEAYLKRFPRLGQPEIVRRLVEQEFRVRQRHGNGPDPASFQKRFPQVALPGNPADTESTAFLSPPQQPGEIGRLGSYRVLKVLGAGGMGVVFLAEDPELKRLVALKAMKPDLARNASGRQRFRREAQAAAAVKHDHVVTIYQVSEDRGIPYLALEYLEGQPLDEVLNRGGPLPLAEVLRLGRQMAAGLQAAHARGLIHRDIKPANIWLESKGAPGAPPTGARVKLLDFGLARAAADDLNLTQIGTLVGTPAYMAPEQARGEAVDHRSDLFSLGCVLYRMCTGQGAFRGTTHSALLLAVATDVPVPPCEVNPAVPQALSDLVKRLLAKKPEERPESAAAVGAALHAIELQLSPGQERAPAAPPPVAAAVQRPRRRRLLVAALVLLAALGATVWLSPTIVRFVTDQGELVVQIDDQEVEVAVKRGDLIIRPRSTEREFVIRAGKGVLEVYRPGEKDALVMKEFELARGGKQIVSVRRAELARADISPRKGITRKPPDLQPALQGPPGPISPLALVTKPAALPGLVSWTVETRGHRSQIYAVAWNNQGDRFATASEDGSVRVWDSASGKLVRIFLHPSGVIAVAWSPDGKRLASGSSDQGVTVWDLESGQGRALTKHGIPRRLAWSPDGKKLVVGTAESRINLYDPSAAKLLDGFIGHTGHIAGLAWSPDGKTLASASKDKTVRLWSVDTNALRLELKGVPVEWDAYLAWSPNGAVISCGTDGQTIRSWVAETGKLLPEVKAGSAVRALTYLPDNKHVASACADATAKLWNVEDGKLARSFVNSPGPIYSMAWSPDANTLVIASVTGAIKVWEPKPGRLAHFIAGQRMYSDTWNSTMVPLAWSPTENNLAVNNQDGRVDVWDLAARKFHTFVESVGPGTSLAWSPDGTILASGAGDSVIRLWSLEKNKGVGDMGNVGGWIYALAWLPDGQALFAGCQAPDIALWDIRKAKKTYPLKEHKAAVSALAISRDGSTLISGDYQGKICVWDLKSKKPAHVLKHGGFVRSLAFFPTGDFFLSSADGGDGIKMWRTAAGTVMDTIKDEGHADCIAFGLSPDAKTLAYGSLYDRKVRLWSLDKKARLRTLEPSLPNRIMKVAWSADGKTIAASSEFDNRIYLWHAATGELQATLFALTSPHGFILSPRGHVSATPEAAAELVYVAQTDRGQETLSAEEFARKYQWNNNP